MISRLIRTALLAQFSAANSGFNDRLMALAPNYPGVEPYQIDWSGTSFNFMFGAVDPDAIEASSTLTFPFLSIDTVNAQDTGTVFASTFSGRVVAVIDVHHSWPNESVLADFSSLVDLTEEAIITCIQDPENQVWNGNLGRVKGGMASSRGRVTFGSENWRQSLRVTVPFNLTV